MNKLVGKLIVVCVLALVAFSETVKAECSFDMTCTFARYDCYVLTCSCAYGWEGGGVADYFCIHGGDDCSIDSDCDCLPCIQG